MSAEDISVRMHVSLKEIVPPLAGGEQFEAKVERVFKTSSGVTEEIPLPKGVLCWGMGYGVKRDDASALAKQYAEVQLARLSGK